MSTDAPPRRPTLDGPPAPGSAALPAGRPERAGRGPTGPAGRRPAARAAHAPDPRIPLVRAFACLWLDVEAGRRPPTQLFRLMDARLVARLAGRWPRRSGAPGRVRSVSGRSTAPGRFDAVAVVERGGRAGALAVRLVRDVSGWKVSEAACPESSVLAG